MQGDEFGYDHTSVHGALDSLRVLDLSRVLAGPWAAQLLGDLGAEVIKVERPGKGDDTRAWGPPFLQDKKGRDTKNSAYYLCANRNKRSIAVDIGTKKGQQLVRDLASVSDIIIENFKKGDLKRYGLDYETLKTHNPRIIYCSITGFGQTGPYADRPGYDFLMQGLGGLMSVTGRHDAEEGAGPIKVGVALTDIMTGMYASTAILAALQARNRTGRGQYIDLALLDVQVASLANQAMNYLYSGKAPERMGNSHPNTVPYQDFRTEDGYIIIAIGNDNQFYRFCEVTGNLQWIKDARFSSNSGRVSHRDALIPMIQAVMNTKTTQYWLSALEIAGVPCGPINNIEQVFLDPQVLARKMRISMPHEEVGDISLIANPIRFSETPVRYRFSPPELGEDTDFVLDKVLGMNGESVKELKNERVVV